MGDAACARAPLRRVTCATRDGRSRRGRGRKREDGHPGRSAGAISGTRKARVANRRLFSRGSARVSQGDCPYEEALYKKWPFERWPKKLSRNPRRQLSTRNERGTRASTFALHVARHADDRHRHAHARLPECSVATRHQMQWRGLAAFGGPVGLRAGPQQHINRIRRAHRRRQVQGPPALRHRHGL